MMDGGRAHHAEARRRAVGEAAGPRRAVRGPFAVPAMGPRVRGEMMIVMTPQAGQDEIDAVVARLEVTGVHVVVMPGELTTAIGAIGDPEGVTELGLEGWPAWTASCRSRGHTSSPRPSSRTTSPPRSPWTAGRSAADPRSA